MDVVTPSYKGTYRKMSGSLIKALDEFRLSPKPFFEYANRDPINAIHLREISLKANNTAKALLVVIKVEARDKPDDIIVNISRIFELDESRNDGYTNLVSEAYTWINKELTKIYGYVPNHETVEAIQEGNAVLEEGSARFSNWESAKAELSK